jgi:hypothetical protein
VSKTLLDDELTKVRKAWAVFGFALLSLKLVMPAVGAVAWRVVFIALIGRKGRVVLVVAVPPVEGFASTPGSRAVQLRSWDDMMEVQCRGLLRKKINETNLVEEIEGRILTALPEEVGGSEGWGSYLRNWWGLGVEEKKSDDSPA